MKSTFLPFKSKQFISLLSLICNHRKQQRYVSVLQTEITEHDETVSKRINNFLHSEEKDKDNLTVYTIRKRDSRSWYKNGKYHRQDKISINGRIETLPALIFGDGSMFWAKYNFMARDDKDENGYYLHNTFSNCGKIWITKEFKLHRDEKGHYGDLENGYFDRNGNFIAYTLPAVINGNKKEWWINGELFRNDKDKNGLTLPTIVGKYIQKWAIGKNKILHRDERDKNGKQLPAVIGIFGHKEWWINGKRERNEYDKNGNSLPQVEAHYFQDEWIENDEIIKTKVNMYSLFSGVIKYLFGGCKSISDYDDEDI